MLAQNKRAITDSEHQYLQLLFAGSVSAKKRILKAALNILVLWFFALLGLLIAAWLVGLLGSAIPFINTLLAMPFLFSGALLLTGGYACYSTYRWLGSWPNPRPLIKKDIALGHVNVESYQVLDACRFQEPEQGGFIYFLKLSEQRVFVIYDYQSQGDQSSDFCVKTNLTLTRALYSGYYLNQVFSGVPIALSGSYPLALEPALWPEPESWSAYNWDQLVNIYAGSAQ